MATTYDFYDASVGTVTNIVAALEGVLNKAKDHASASKLPEARLYEDMLPLTYQVHIVTDFSQKLVSRMTGSELKSWAPDDLKTFDEMLSRVAEAKKLLPTVSRETANSVVGKHVTVGMGPGKNLDLSMKDYVSAQLIPNLFFHLTTAYNICRANGVSLGKVDYVTPWMGPLMN